MSWYTLEEAAKLLGRSEGHLRRRCAGWRTQRKAKLVRRNGHRSSWIIHGSIVVGQSRTAEPTPARVVKAPADAIVIIIPPGAAEAARKLLNVPLRDV